MKQHNGTLEYRNDLQKSLEVARLRLSNSDFRRLAIGIRAEIARIDNEIARKELEDFLGCSESTVAQSGQFFMTVVRETAAGCFRGLSATVALNTPSSAVPWNGRGQTKFKNKSFGIPVVAVRQ